MEGKERPVVEEAGWKPRSWPHTVFRYYDVNAMIFCEAVED